MMTAQKCLTWDHHFSDGSHKGYLDLLRTCKSPSQIQSKGAVGLVILDGHLNLPASDLCAHTGKHAHFITPSQHTSTLTVLVTTIDTQWEGMGDVGSARYEPALLPPCPTIRILSYSN